jgi:hypothetical protein
MTLLFGMRPSLEDPNDPFEFSDAIPQTGNLACGVFEVNLSEGDREGGRQQSIVIILYVLSNHRAD